MSDLVKILLFILGICATIELVRWWDIHKTFNKEKK